MIEFKDKVAVITGGASGIGLGVVTKCVEREMKVIILDVDKNALEKVESRFSSLGNVKSYQVDVSNAEQMKDIAETIFSEHKKVDFLFLNAGVSVRVPLWEHTIKDWEWLIGVNLMGVIYGVKFFIPKMLEQKFDCYVVTCSSVNGLMKGNDAYSVTKHAIVALTEALEGQVNIQSKFLKVHVICPGPTNTGILDSERIRPEGLKNTPGDVSITPELEAQLETNLNTMRIFNENGLQPEEVGEVLLNSLGTNKLYILPDKGNQYKNNIRRRFKQILKNFEVKK